MASAATEKSGQAGGRVVRYALARYEHRYIARLGDAGVVAPGCSRPRTAQVMVRGAVASFTAFAALAGVAALLCFCGRSTTRRGRSNELRQSC